MNGSGESGYTALVFSVIIANHNYERYLKQAIDSALAVDWPNIEVIVGFWLLIKGVRAEH